ncbi:MAG: DUF1385 domain-containing protein, partial [Armatimonadetes bacterium]|nr:DUF1385 domain-containing protein [Armatimonadota bacterium]
VGTISERAIAAHISAADDVDAALDLPISSLVEPGATLIDIRVSLKEAARIFANSGEDVLPVTDEDGVFRGVLYRRDVIGLLTRNLRPPTVAGMATPLGVYLTTGSVSAGAGDLGLFLTGASLALMIILAGLIVDGLQRIFSLATGINVAALLSSPPLTYPPNVYDLAFYVTVALTVIVFFVLMRLSPLSGYHAAEHMTVHAIEAGEALVPENVRRMPRVHPRCGTNILAAAGVFVILTSKVSSSFSVLLALLVVAIGWRTVGGWLQYLVTTRDPSEKQLASGVKAGNELIRRFQEQPHVHTTGFQRIWNIGFPQVAAGMATVLWLVQTVFGTQVI